MSCTLLLPFVPLTDGEGYWLLLLALLYKCACVVLCVEHLMSLVAPDVVVVKEYTPSHCAFCPAHFLKYFVFSPKAPTVTNTISSFYFYLPTSICLLNHFLSHSLCLSFFSASLSVTLSAHNIIRHLAITLCTQFIQLQFFLNCSSFHHWKVTYCLE